MSIYIQDQYPRSRLTLTYRTMIDGAPVDQTIPFRVLVLGDFSGQGPNDPKDPVVHADADMQPPLGWKSVADRDVISIPKGIKLEDALAQLGVTWRISRTKFPDLFTEVEGDFMGDVSCDVDAALDAVTAGATTASFAATGTLVLEGKQLDPDLTKCNGLGDFTGSFPVTVQVAVAIAWDAAGKATVTVDANAAKSVAVKLTGTVAGPVPGQTAGQLTGDVSDTENAALSSYSITVVDGRQILRGSLAGKAWVKLTLPIQNLDSFSPDTIGGYVPEIRRLRLIDDSIGTLQSLILSNAGLKDAVRSLLASSGAAQSLKDLRTGLIAFEPYAQVDRPAVPPAASTTPPAVPAAAKTLAQAAYPSETPKGQEFVVNTLVADPTSTTAAPKPPLHAGLALYDRSDTIQDADRFVNYLAAFFANLTEADLADLTSINALTKKMVTLKTRIEGKINKHVTDVLSDETFQTLERCWRGLEQLCGTVTDPNVIIDVLDVTKFELGNDLSENGVDLFKSPFFKKLYQNEYDQYGGMPFGVMLGLFEFGYASDDLAWLETMASVANLAHCPFISAAKTWEDDPKKAPSFFNCKSIDEFDQIEDFDVVLSQPRYGKWAQFRELPTAPYIGLTLPRYLLREPWGAEDGQPGNRNMDYVELQEYDVVKDKWKDRAWERRDYLWGNSAILFGCNLVRSFQLTGWCQRIRGENGGGMIEGLAVHTVEKNGRTEIQPPIEVALPDYKELQLSQDNGFVPLIWRKGTADATFFSARSIKKADQYKDEIATQNADLVVNLAYTLSITRIAHYIKLITRPYIGTTADKTYLQTLIETWLKGYVTTVVNPDDLTVQRYPFKAISVDVEPKPGPLGWYTAVVAILPHIQFEGMDVELRLEASLGAAK